MLSVFNTAQSCLLLDWPHSVTDETDLYAHTISEAYNAHLKELDEVNETSESSTNGAAVTHGASETAKAQVKNGSSDPKEEQKQKQKQRHIVPGLDGLGDGLSKDGNERARNMSILCGSMHPYEEAHATGSDRRESVFVFPDYKVRKKLTSFSTKIEWTKGSLMLVFLVFLLLISLPDGLAFTFYERNGTCLGSSLTSYFESSIS